MKQVTIHVSGHGADRLEVVSYGNGLAYDFRFGEAGAPMRNVFVQGDDAQETRDAFDTAEEREPEADSRDLWLSVIDQYL